jgi:hypothetical protein
MFFSIEVILIFSLSKDYTTYYNLHSLEEAFIGELLIFKNIKNNWKYLLNDQLL